MWFVENRKQTIIINCSMLSTIVLPRSHTLCQLVVAYGEYDYWYFVLFGFMWHYVHAYIAEE